MRHLLCLGLGYSAQAIAARCVADGWRVTGTSRTAAGARRIEAAGYGAIEYDGMAASASLAAVLAEASHVVVSAPPDAAGDPFLRHHGDDVAASRRLGWIGYLSTIGVYGDRQGEWIDESAVPAPGSARAHWRLAAERQWQEIGAVAGKTVQVFRLPGIYGPGRSAVDQLRAGTARRIVKPGHVFNRIHVADIAAVVLAGMARADQSAVFNAVDDEPAPQEEVVTFAASLLGVRPPPAETYETAALSDMGRSFYGACKRVANQRIKADLGVTLAYPTYREGLAAIVAEQKTDRCMTTSTKLLT